MNKQQFRAMRKKERALLKQADADRARGIKTGPWSGLGRLKKYKSGVVRNISPEQYLREQEEAKSKDHVAE